MRPAVVTLALGTAEPGFDLLLIGHVACTLLGFGTLATSAIQAARLSRRGPGEAGAPLRRYFAPGANWAGRTLYGVPLFGLALLADSGSRDRIADGWVLAGLGLWALAALVAEGWLWPAERRIRSTLLDAGSNGPRGPVAPTGSVHPVGAAIGRDCRVVSFLGAALSVVFIVATVVMVARPG